MLKFSLPFRRSIHLTRFSTPHSNVIQCFHQKKQNWDETCPMYTITLLLNVLKQFIWLRSQKFVLETYRFMPKWDQREVKIFFKWKICRKIFDCRKLSVLWHFCYRFEWKWRNQREIFSVHLCDGMALKCLLECFGLQQALKKLGRLEWSMTMGIHRNFVEVYHVQQVLGTWR